MTPVEVVGQPDPVLLDAARRAGEVLAELARVESAIETVAAQIDRGRRGQLSGVVTRLGELRAKLRPVAALDIDARERAAADLRETDERAAVAAARPAGSLLWQRTFESAMRRYGGCVHEMRASISAPPMTDTTRAALDAAIGVQAAGGADTTAAEASLRAAIAAERDPVAVGVVDAVLWAVAQCHDGSDLWAHMKRDPGAFRRDVARVLYGKTAAIAARAIRDHDATWQAHDLERDAEVERWQGEAHALVWSLKSIASAVGAPDVPSGDGWAERAAAVVIGKAARPTPDEARRLVAELIMSLGAPPVEESDATTNARKALLRALGVEG